MEWRTFLLSYGFFIMIMHLISQKSQIMIEIKYDP